MRLLKKEGLARVGSKRADAQRPGQMGNLGMSEQGLSM
jgi:hypothetical protein